DRRVRPQDRGRRDGRGAPDQRRLGQRCGRGAGRGGAGALGAGGRARRVRRVGRGIRLDRALRIDARAHRRSGEDGDSKKVEVKIVAASANTANLSAEDLKKKADQLRLDTLRMVYEANSGHAGGGLGAADLLTVLYYRYMKHNPQDP